MTQDIGLCVPLALDTMNTTKHGTLGGLERTEGAIVATVESSSISACSAKSTVRTQNRSPCIEFC